MYVDDIFEVVKKSSVQGLTEFLNNLDDSGSIKFTYEMKSEGKLPFLDLLIIRKDTGALNLQIYRKPTHTDQYLNFNSYRPIEHKLSVVRTLFDRSQSVTSDSTDIHAEDLHIEKALRDCGYSAWTFQKIKKADQDETFKEETKHGFS